VIAAAAGVAEHCVMLQNHSRKCHVQVLYAQPQCVWCWVLCVCLCRGIDVVRNKIKMFAQKKVTLPPGRHKIVILDEADRLAE
jgi:hypothetical protein